MRITDSSEESMPAKRPQAISSTEKEAQSIIFPRDYNEWFPLRCDQVIFWLCKHLNGANAINIAYRTNEKLDIKLLKKALTYTINKHPMCKVQFANFKMQQRYVENVEADIECIKLTPGINEIEALKKYQINLYTNNPINLNKAPLLKVKVLSSVDGNRDYIILCIAHIISDFSSILIIYQTLLDSYYNYLQKNDKNLTLPDYNEAYNHIILGKIQLNQEIAEMVNFWEKYTKNAPRLEFPLSIMSFKRSYKYDNMVAQHLPSEIISKLKERCAQNNISLNMTFIALSGLLFACYSNTNTSYIYSAGSGRNNKTTQRVVGYLITFKLWGVPIVPKASLSEHLSNFLFEIKGSLKHQHAPAVIKGWAHYKNMCRLDEKNNFLTFQIIKRIKNWVNGNIEQAQIEGIVGCYIQHIVFSFKMFIARTKGLIFKRALNLKIPMAVVVNMPYGQDAEKNVLENVVFTQNGVAPLSLINRNQLYLYLFLDGAGGINAALNGILSEDAKKKILHDLYYLIECLVKNPDTKVSEILEKIHGWD